MSLTLLRPYSTLIIPSILRQQTHFLKDPIIITLYHWLQPATLPPLPSDETSHGSIILTDTLNPYTNLQETPILKAELVWFTEGPCLWNNSGKCQPGNAVVWNNWKWSPTQSHFCLTDKIFWSLWTCTLATNRTPNNLYLQLPSFWGGTWFWYALETKRFSNFYWPKEKNKTKPSNYVLELLEAIQKPKSLAIIKIPRH